MRALRHLTAGTVTILALVASVLSTASPAAAATGTVSASNGVLLEGCEDYDYQWSVGPGARNWNLDVTLIGPDGGSASSDYQSGTYSSSGTGSFFLCDSDGAGTYRIEAELTEYGASYSSEITTTSTASFTLRKPKSRVTLSASPTRPRFNGVVTLRAQVQQEQRYGYGKAAYGYVRLEVLTEGAWRPVPQGKVVADGRGVAVTRYRWNIRGPVRLRARALPSHYSESYSSPITVRTR